MWLKLLQVHPLAVSGIHSALPAENTVINITCNLVLCVYVCVCLFGSNPHCVHLGLIPGKCAQDCSLKSCRMGFRVTWAERAISPSKLLSLKFSALWVGVVHKPHVKVYGSWQQAIIWQSIKGRSLLKKPSPLFLLDGDLRGISKLRFLKPSFTDVTSDLICWLKNVWSISDSIPHEYHFSAK